MTESIQVINVQLINNITGQHSIMTFEQNKKTQMSKTQLFAVLNAIIGSPETLEQFLDESFTRRELSSNKRKSMTSATVGNHSISLELPIMYHEHSALYCDTIHPILISDVSSNHAIIALIR